MFGFHRRLVRRCECETDLPKLGFRPVTWQCADIGVLSPSAHPYSASDWTVGRTGVGADIRIDNSRRLRYPGNPHFGNLIFLTSCRSADVCRGGTASCPRLEKAAGHRYTWRVAEEDQCCWSPLLRASRDGALGVTAMPAGFLSCAFH